MSFGAGASPSASSEASSQSGNITVGPVAGPAVNLNGPGEMSPVVVGAVAVAVLFGVILFFTMRK